MKKYVIAFLLCGVVFTALALLGHENGNAAVVEILKK